MNAAVYRPALLCATLAAGLAASAAQASSPTAWQQQEDKALRVCAKASGLLHAEQVGTPMQFDDRSGQTALLIRGAAPQAHMQGAAVTMLCLVNRRSGQASLVEWTGSPSPGDAAAPAPIVLPLPTAPAALVVAQEPGEPASIGTYSVRLYRDLAAGDYVDGLIRPRNGELRQAQLKDMDGDGQAELVVTLVTAGSGNYQTVDVYKIEDGQHLQWASGLSKTP
ncbi:PliI family lysozyme inhibitor of I-type lysozyme [Bordetella petrii]|uniref:PliI family lysozyme inhibitor of I-type lysozyme n=1 Tax=Bordetella petrii TaxID=94624 RepID=UPI001E2C3BFA|nr:PliI family lysozyme inhibitor of I-type lysozyme [Bordetella petrii]MCD0504420.1 PliI family lysozyme inhibitor of I-type lysozyme [Bordetella petrii]